MSGSTVYFPPVPSGGGGGSSSYQSAVASVASLPASGNALFDVRYVVAANTLYVWNGTAWGPIASGAGGSGNNFFPSGWL